MGLLSLPLMGSILCVVSFAAASNEAPVESDSIMRANNYTAQLERGKEICDYRIKNLGKKFYELDKSKMGGFGEFKDVGVVTNGMIGMCFAIGNPGKAADYYYQDWKVLDDCERRRRAGQKVTWECWPAPQGEYRPFGEAMYLWEQAGQYEKMLEHYQEYHDDYFYVIGRGTNSQAGDFPPLENEILQDPELEQAYNSFMDEWEKVKELVKAGTPPKPLDPDVQNHEWFYSDNQGEVLTALEYYYKHKVKFMLEKARKHKDLVVAKKAKEYLKKLARDK